MYLETAQASTSTTGGNPGQLQSLQLLIEGRGNANPNARAAA